MSQGQTILYGLIGMPALCTRLNPYDCSFDQWKQVKEAKEAFNILSILSNKNEQCLKGASSFIK